MVTGKRATARMADDDDTMLDDLQRKAFRFFDRHTNPETGLVLDSTQPGQPASIAAVGFALSCYPIGVERGWILYHEALALTLAALRFFDAAQHDGKLNATGYKASSSTSCT